MKSNLLWNQLFQKGILQEEVKLAALAWGFRGI